MTEEGKLLVSQVRSRYLDILYKHLVSKYSSECGSDEDEVDILAATRIGQLLTLLSSIMVSHMVYVITFMTVALTVFINSSVFFRFMQFCLLSSWQS